MTRTLHSNSTDPYQYEIKKKKKSLLGYTTPGLKKKKKKKVMQPNDENACQTNTYLVSHTDPTTLKFSQLPPAPTGNR